MEYVTHSTAETEALGRRLAEKLESSRAGGILLSAAEPVALGMLLLVNTAFLVDGSFNPFLYFRF